MIGIVMDTGNTEEKDEEAVETAKLLAEIAETDYPFLIPDPDMMNGDWKASRRTRRRFLSIKTARS